MPAFQDYYPENVAHCYGCGKLNAHGHQIKTDWDGDETVTRFTPRPEHPPPTSSAPAASAT